MQEVGSAYVTLDARTKGFTSNIDAADRMFGTSVRKMDRDAAAATSAIGGSSAKMTRSLGKSVKGISKMGALFGSASQSVLSTGTSLGGLGAVMGAMSFNPVITGLVAVGAAAYGTYKIVGFLSDQESAGETQARHLAEAHADVVAAMKTGEGAITAQAQGYVGIIAAQNASVAAIVRLRTAQRTLTEITLGAGRGSETYRVAALAASTAEVAAETSSNRLANAHARLSEAERTHGVNSRQYRDAQVAVSRAQLAAAGDTTALAAAKQHLAQVENGAGKTSKVYRDALVAVKIAEVESRLAAQARDASYKAGIKTSQDVAKGIDGEIEALKKRKQGLELSLNPINQVAAGEKATAKNAATLAQVNTQLANRTKAAAAAHREAARTANDMAAAIGGATPQAQALRDALHAIAQQEIDKANVVGAIDAIAGAAANAGGIVQGLIDKLFGLSKTPRVTAHGGGTAPGSGGGASPVTHSLDELDPRIRTLQDRAASASASGGTPETKKAAKKAADAAIKAASDAVDARRSVLSDAFGRVARLAMVAFDQKTRAGLESITRSYDAGFAAIQRRADAALAAIEARYAAARSAVESGRAAATPAEAQIAAIQGARDAQRLQQSVSDAAAALAAANRSHDRAAAVAAQRQLNDALTDITLAGLQTQAEAQRAQRDADAAGQLDSLDRQQADEQARVQAGYDAERAALQAQLDSQTLQYQTARDIQAGNLQRALDAQLAKMQAHGKSVGAAERQVAKLLKGYGVDFKESGEVLGRAFNVGLSGAIGDIGTTAQRLAREVAKYLRLSSPAEKGPLASLDSWWNAFTPTLSAGLDTGGLTASIAGAATPGARAGGGGATVVIQVSGNTILGSDRGIADELARIIRPALDRQIRLVS